MENLQSILSMCFHSIPNNRSANISSLNKGDAFMTIPLQGNTVCVPVFALSALTAINEEPSNLMQQESLVVRLDTDSATVSAYKSLDTKVRHALQRTYKAGICRVDMSVTECYYGTLGAIFGKDLNPVMMLMWEIERFVTDNGTPVPKFRFKRPVVQILPSVLQKRDAMERYIVNQVLAKALALGDNVCTPYGNINGHFDFNHNSHFSVRAVIDKFGFKMTRIDKPSISTTNRELLGIALDNLEETVQ